MTRAAAALGVLAAIVISGLRVHGTQVGPAAEAVDACLPSLVGTWKRDAGTDEGSQFVEFTAQGWASLLELIPGSDPPGLEIAAQVPFRLVPPPDLRVEFDVGRGNDRFPPGISSWAVVAYDDLSFTARDRETRTDTRWVRLLMQRYFITFAAVARDGPNTGSAFVMLTRLDGRHMTTEALGLHTDRRGTSQARFGRIPDLLAQRFVRDRGSDPMLRLELSEAEYQRTRELFDAWVERAKDDQRDAAADVLAADLLVATVASLNRCANRIAVDEQTSPTLVSVVRALRKVNDVRHVADDQFPFAWEPPPIN